MNDQHMSFTKAPYTSECREIFKQRRRIVDEMFERYGIFPPEAQVDNLFVSFNFKV